MGIHRRAWLANAAMSAVSCTAMFGCSESRKPSEIDELEAALVPNSEKPLALFWNDVKLQEVVAHKRRWTAIQRFLWLPFPELRYHRLHWLRFFGPFFRLAAKTTNDFVVPGSETHRWRESFDQFLSELMNSEAYDASYHDRLHLRTPHGISFITAEQQVAREAKFADPHPNKILSLFALSGITLDCTLGDCTLVMCRGRGARPARIVG